jgi:cell division protease FtsH
MSERLGLVQLAPRENRYLGMAGFGEPRPFGEDTACIVDAEVQRIISECHEQAKELLVAHRPALDALVQALLARETLDEREILDTTGLPAAPPLANRPSAPPKTHRADATQANRRSAA